MARTTATEVKAIMDNCPVSDDDVTNHYISAASALVTGVFGDDADIGDTLIEEIERWFTAHMIASSRYRTLTSERLGDASVSYTVQFRENLSSTPYGQMVLQLDITGKMGDVGKKAARIRAIKSFDD